MLASCTLDKWFPAHPGLRELPDLQDVSVAEALRSLRLFFGRASDFLGLWLKDSQSPSKTYKVGIKLILSTSVVRFTLCSYLRGPSLMTFGGTVALHLFLVERLLYLSCIYFVATSRTQFTLQLSFPWPNIVCKRCCRLDLAHNQITSMTALTTSEAGTIRWAPPGPLVGLSFCPQNHPTSQRHNVTFHD